MIYLLSIFLLLNSCNDDFCRLSDSFFSEKCAGETHCLVDFNELLGIDWDDMYFFESWTYPEDMSVVMGVNHSLEIVPEGQTYVVFVKSNEIIKYYSTDCFLTFLGQIKNKNNGSVKISSDNAIFKVEIKIFGGKPSYYLRLQDE